MSYQVDVLNSQGALQTASVNFATGADANSTFLLATLAASQAYLIDWITCAASSFGAIWIESATGNASAGVGGSSYYKWFPGQNGFQEEVRIITKAGSPVVLEAQAAIGNGLFRCMYRIIKASTNQGPFANAPNPDV